MALKQVAQLAQSLTDSDARSRLKVDARLLGELAKERWAARGTKVDVKASARSDAPSVSATASHPVPRREATFEANAEE